jgi:hypothetical protein
MAAVINEFLPDDRLVPPQWGGPLNEADYADLARCWIMREIADAAMLRQGEYPRGPADRWPEAQGLRGPALFILFSR